MIEFRNVSLAYGGNAAAVRDLNFTVNDGDRVCQAVIKEYTHVEWEPTTRLDRTKREDGSFGHTGVN